MSKIHVGLNAEFSRSSDKPFEWAVQKAAEMGYKYFEPMVHFGRELMSEAGYFHTVSMFDDPWRIKEACDRAGLKISGLQSHGPLGRPDVFVLVGVDEGAEAVVREHLAEQPFVERAVDDVHAGHGGVAGLGVHADRFRRRVVAPLVATEGFLGLALGAAPRLDVLVESLRRVAGATVEWMTHPGAMPGRPGTYGGDAARDEELALLTHPAARAAVEAAGFALASFRDLLA